MELKTNKTVTIKVNDDNKKLCGENCNYLNISSYACYCNLIDTEDIKILKEDENNAMQYCRHSECIKMFDVDIKRVDILEVVKEYMPEKYNFYHQLYDYKNDYIEKYNELEKLKENIKDINLIQNKEKELEELFNKIFDFCRSEKSDCTEYIVRCFLFDLGLTYEELYPKKEVIEPEY